ncbi:A20/AN1-like zinc finger family protein [Striga asiatica]|uniref:A20/AN1-like zinc finger family protein n=1 Tax=Striga asiatica TaxID=4170 RepID=A0A5A7QQK3_STRAF|nr:A20/AN1-like zinc finger family protein [Striga asiatica]
MPAYERTKDILAGSIGQQISLSQAPTWNEALIRRREKRKRRRSSRYYRTTSRCASTAGSQNHASAASRILCQKCFNSVKSRAAAVDRSFRSSPPARFSMEGRLDFPPVSGDPEKEALVESAA